MASDKTIHRGIWVLAEQFEGRVLRISHELLTRARTLADARKAPLTAVILGNGLRDDALRELIERGADRVLAVEAPELAAFTPEPYAAVLHHLMSAERPEIVLAGATSTGRTVMPYVAVKLHAGLTADCTELSIDPDSGDLLQTRPAIGGNVLATIRTPHHRPQMATVRPHSTQPAPRQSGRTGEILRVAPPAECLHSRVKRLRFEPHSEKRGLQDADIVVSVGHGVKTERNIARLLPLAESLGAGLGASRDVVDRGWLSYPHQVGLSGKTVSPRLYVALAISGAVQHLAGMQTSGAVVAVNSDPDARIFSVADLGIVGDVFEVVSALVERLRKERNAP